MTSITFVVPVANEDIFRRCLLSSRIFQIPSCHELIVQRGWRSAAAAFNEAITRAENDIIVCLHEDVLLPPSWPQQLLGELENLEKLHGSFGVVGCAGATRGGRAAAHIYRHDREFHTPVPLPAAVETLDEMLICFRRSSGLTFDHSLPSFFGYAVDLCLQATSRGLQSFVVDAPCFHQAKSREGRLPEGFFINWNYLCEKWKSHLPVHTLTGTLHYKRSFVAHKFKEFVKNRFRHIPEPWWKNLPKIDPDSILNAIQEPHASLVRRDEGNTIAGVCFALLEEKKNA
jgi:hypothetical protein